MRYKVNYQIKVTLLGTKPPVWRRLVAPAEITLGRLHEVLQCAMGWLGGHLHGFSIDGEEYGPPDPDGFGFGDAPIDERKVRLSAVLGVGGRAVYTYDFGDNWEHAIVVEKEMAAEPGVKYPVCTGGKRACPPEDCGGVPGFYDLLEALKNPAAKGSADLLEWVEEGYDPEAFSVEAVNRALRGRG